MIIQKSFALAGVLTSLVFAPGLAVAQTPTSPASSSTRVAVLGSASDPASASVLVAALQAAEKERGITINTSHVDYETTKRSGRAGLAEAIASGDHYEAAILIGTGGDLRDVVDAAQLASVLGFPQLLISLDSATGTPESLALLQNWLAYLGYPPANTAVFMIELDQIRCQTSPGVGSLLDAVLKLAPQPPDLRAPFLMPIADVAKTPQGVEAFGEIAAGTIRVGDPVEIVGFREEPLKSTITGVEMFRKLLDRGEAGDNVGLLLRGIDKKDIRRGMVVVKPGSVTAHREFQAQVYVLKKEEGGRHTPFHNRMAPEIIIRTAQVEGSVTVAEQGGGGGGGGGGAGGIVTGLTSVNVKLIVPIAMDKGLRFAIREGGRTVGAGQVTEIIK